MFWNKTHSSFNKNLTTRSPVFVFVSFLAHYVVTNENGSGFVGTVDMQLTNTAIIAFLFSVSSNDAR